MEDPAGSLSMQEPSAGEDENAAALPAASDEADDPTGKLHPVEDLPLDGEVEDGDALSRAAAPAEGAAFLDQHELEYLEQMERRRKQMHAVLLDKTKVPASYYTTSKKEALVQQYVDNFKRQYSQLFPGRKDLLLCPENEFGIKKFVCTTIRPTQLPFKELYDYRSCARFVADYISYKPLDPPHELPSLVPSPTYTLKMQNGNCFDTSIILVSLLRGFGYDAYVVSGYAVREITVLDETKTDSDAVGIKHPLSGGKTGADGKPQDAEDALSVESAAAAAAAGSKYKVKPPRQLKSQFLLKQEMKRKEKEKNELLAKKLEEERQRALLIEDDDELKGLRIHAWVLVLPGKREVAESFFIESSTGRIYSTENENYLGVESVFNSTNYWVNMQVCYDGLKGIQFDLGDNSKWEFVLLDNNQPGVASKSKGDPLNDKGDVSDEEDAEEANLEILDLPPSWVDKLVVSREQFESKCPAGSKAVIYRNARVESFSDYHRHDGMVARNTFFADESNNFEGEIREYFRNRRDKLRERLRVPYTGKIHEFFDPGRPHGLKEHVTIEGKTTEIHFYPSARSDGLVKRIEKPNKVMEYFTEREDRLSYRSVTFETAEIPEEYVRDPSFVSKMTEKFERSPELPAHEDSKKQTYFIKDEKIRVTYHLEDGRIIDSYKEFKKPNSEQKSGVFEPPVCFEVNPFLKAPKKQHLYAELCNLIRAEQACAQAIKASEREIAEILQARAAEERDVVLTTSIYDTVRNNIRIPNEEEKDSHKKEEEEAKGADLDYLSPFLVNHPSQNGLTKEEAQAVKDSCLKSLKERLIEKANIIQSRLEEVTSEYQRRQLAYSRNADSMTVEETDEYVRFCNDSLFTIHILEKRLAKHKEAAPERYIQLDAKLKGDARLL
ncbi:hypothetical protein DFJ73DRAFT_834662 [Zopfochytrium polystomum]|nr:hypothetical protein DFJ73DRAFT_834662 [Zopfochytrium polystomum]